MIDHNNKSMSYESDSTECVICSEELDKEKEFIMLLCAHKYHKICIRKWIDENDTCPIDRKKIPVILYNSLLKNNK